MENKKTKLYINTMIIFFSKFCTQFLLLLLLPIITSKLTTSEYGTFDLITSYAWLIVPFMTMRIENGIFRYLIDARDNKYQSKQIISNGIIAIIVQIIVFSVIYFLIVQIFNINYSIYIFLYAFSIIILNIIHQIVRGFGDNVSYAFSSIITGMSNVVLSFITIYYLRIGLLGLIISGIVSNLFGTLYIIIKKKIFRYISIRNMNKNNYKEIVKYSVPLVPNDVSSWLINVSDRIMLSSFIGTAANGIYSVANKFPTLLTNIYNVFNLSWVESASENSKDIDRDDFFSQTIDSIFRICSSFCLIIMSAMNIIFKFMIDNSYEEAYNYIPLLIVASLFQCFSGIIASCYISLKKSKDIAISTFVVGCINIFINLVFIRKFGIYAACLSTLIAYLLLSLYRGINIRKFIKIKYNYKTFIIIVLSFMINYYLYFKNKTVFCIINIIIAMLISFLLNKSIIFEGINRLKYLKATRKEKYE